MNPITKYLIGALLVVSFAAASYGLWKRSEVIRLQGYTQALENRVAGLLASQRAIQDSLNTLQREKSAAEDRARKATKDLNEALKNDRDWADAHVPPGVCSSLPGCTPS